MTTDRNENNGHQSDAKLDAMLNAWQVPAPSPWLARKAAQGIIAGHIAENRGHAPWPMAPMRLAAAVSMAAVVGLVLGLTVPGADDANAANDSDTMIEMMW